MTFTRIIAHDSVNSPGLRLRLSRAADGDPVEIYLAQELTLPEQVHQP